MHLQALPAFNDNYIWTLAREPGAAAIVVDPGDAGPVIAAAGAGLRPAAILLTHHHPDHAGGIGALLQRWPELPVFAPRDERIDCPGRRVVDDGDLLEAAGFAARVIAVPGHTRSHVAFHVPGAGPGVLFSGDTLFSLGCGRLFEGSPAQMHASLSRLAALPPATLVCCGHEYTLANGVFAREVEPGNEALMRRCEEARTMREAGHPTLPSTLASEVACNPFLRCGEPAVGAAVRQRLGRAPADEVEVFAGLRQWKDGFRA